MARFYTVQETAKILGFSTNSVYKFLDQGRLKSTRGNSKQGRFRVPHSSIEEFLDTKLSEIAVARALAASTPTKPDAITPRHLISPEEFHAKLTPPPPSPRTKDQVLGTKLPLGLALTRLLILIALLLTIVETIVTPTVTLAGQFFRLLILTIAILLAYQSGGSVNDELKS